MAFGIPQKYIQLPLNQENKNNWDIAVNQADIKFTEEEVLQSDLISLIIYVKAQFVDVNKHHHYDFYYII